ncbi:MAG: hypothetical protein WCD18_27630, partial [Thermosynechococcaceae cyanobacterium]
MSKKQRLLVLFIGSFVILVGLAIYNIHPVLNYLCSSRESIAELDVQSQRTVIIMAGRCWEISRPIYYEVREAGRLVTPTTYISGDSGNEAHAYKVVYAESGALVGVIETTRAQPELVLIQDFKSGESWPRLRDNEVSYEEPVQRKWKDIFERLRRENLQIPTPDYFKP